MVSLNASFSILGNNSLSKSLDSSMQGLVLTSINQTFNKSSIIKSYPNISKQYLYSFNRNDFLTA